MSDPASLSLDQLEDEIATLASHIYAGTCPGSSSSASSTGVDALLSATGAPVT